MTGRVLRAAAAPARMRRGRRLQPPLPPARRSGRAVAGRGRRPVRIHGRGRTPSGLPRPGASPGEPAGDPPCPPSLSGSARATRPGPERGGPTPHRPRPAGSCPAFAPARASTSAATSRHCATSAATEFGTSIARPSEGHIQAVNELLGPAAPAPGEGRRATSSGAGRGRPRPGCRRDLAELLRLKSRAHDWVRATERVWDFYFELFGQRQSAVRRVAVRLRPDRAGLLPARLHAPGHAAQRSRARRRSPTCAPGSRRRRTGATSRCASSAGSSTRSRWCSCRTTGMVNPWTMGAILHEVSHNLQNELGAGAGGPARDRAAGSARPACSPTVARTSGPAGTARSSRDMVGCLLGGEAFVASLMDVIGRGPEQALAFSPHGVHPTPYLRTFLSTRAAAPDGLPRDRHASTSGSGAGSTRRPPARTIPRALLRQPHGRRAARSSTRSC